MDALTNARARRFLTAGEAGPAVVAHLRARVRIWDAPGLRRAPGFGTLRVRDGGGPGCETRREDRDMWWIRRQGWWRPGLALGLSLAVATCTDLTTPGVQGGATNVPAVGVTSQSFGFAVQAINFSFEDTYASPTVGDSLAVGLAVVGYLNGSALIEVRDSSGAAIDQQTVTQGIAQGTTTIHGTPPYTVHLLFTAFTGTFSLGVNAQTP
jgi:hypothetical protein